MKLYPLVLIFGRRLRNRYYFPQVVSVGSFVLRSLNMAATRWVDCSESWSRDEDGYAQSRDEDGYAPSRDEDGYAPSRDEDASMAIAPTRPDPYTAQYLPPR